MVTYRAGQKVRIEWPDGSAIEGTVKMGRGFATSDSLPCVDVPRSETRIFLSGDEHKGGTITVLSEPRPEEPTGLGAVVEAVFHSPLTTGASRQVWVRRVGDQRQKWVSEDARWYASWDNLTDPVVLHEGWHRE